MLSFDFIFDADYCWLFSPFLIGLSFFAIFRHCHYLIFRHYFDCCCRLSLIIFAISLSMLIFFDAIRFRWYFRHDAILLPRRFIAFRAIFISLFSYIADITLILLLSMMLPCWCFLRFHALLFADDRMIYLLLWYFVFDFRYAFIFFFFSPLFRFLSFHLLLLILFRFAFRHYCHAFVSHFLMLIFIFAFRYWLISFFDYFHFFIDCFRFAMIFAFRFSLLMPLFAMPCFFAAIISFSFTLITLFFRLSDYYVTTLIFRRLRHAAAADADILLLIAFFRFSCFRCCFCCFLHYFRHWWLIAAITPMLIFAALFFVIFAYAAYYAFRYATLLCCHYTVAAITLRYFFRLITLMPPLLPLQLPILRYAYAFSPLPRSIISIDAILSFSLFAIFADMLFADDYFLSFSLFRLSLTLISFIAIDAFFIITPLRHAAPFFRRSRYWYLRCWRAIFSDILFRLCCFDVFALLLPIFSPRFHYFLSAFIDAFIFILIIAFAACRHFLRFSDFWLRHTPFAAVDTPPFSSFTLIFRALMLISPPPLLIAAMLCCWFSLLFFSMPLYVSCAICHDDMRYTGARWCARLYTLYADTLRRSPLFFIRHYANMPIRCCIDFAAAADTDFFIADVFAPDYAADYLPVRAAAIFVCRRLFAMLMPPRRLFFA